MLDFSGELVVALLTFVLINNNFVLLLRLSGFPVEELQEDRKRVFLSG